MNKYSKAALLTSVLFLLYFYRDPDLSLKRSQIDNSYLVSPGDGLVSKIYRKGGYINIWIYLNLFNIHTQYVPISGVITNKTYKKGSFHPAYFLQKSQYNERLSTEIQTRHFGKIVVTQVAGQIARAIVNNKNKGEFLKQGQRLGRILLGSSVILSIPESEYILGRIKFLIKEGDRVEINQRVIKKI